MFLYNRELYHAGIKGQRWGVRRFQNKDGSLTPEGKKRYGTAGPETKIKSKTFFEERRMLREKYILEDPDHARTEKYRKQIHELLSKYDFDGDDGGGGSTDADRKAGKKYMELWEKYERLSSEITARANKKVTNTLIEKYGEKRVRDIETANNIKAGIATAAYLLAVPAGIMMYKHFSDND